MQLQELNKKHKGDGSMNLIDCKKTKFSWTLTINFFFHGSIGMEDIECMDKFLKFNNAIFLFIEKIKNLGKEKEKKKKLLFTKQWSNCLSNKKIDSDHENTKKFSPVLLEMLAYIQYNLSN